MTRTRLLVLLCFCLAFAAGISAGVAWSRFNAKPRRGSWITRELGLTSEQREQMWEIWSGVIGARRKRGRASRQALRKERDESLQNLLSEKQKVEYEEVMKTYAEKSAAFDKERKAAFDEAVERTKQILTKPQRKKYEELIKRRPQFGRYRHGRSKERSRRKEQDTPSSNGE